MTHDTVTNQAQKDFTTDFKIEKFAIDPLAKLHDDARSFMNLQKFSFENEFYETHGKEVIKFKVFGDDGKKKINCWLKCSYPQRDDGAVGLCITFGAHHNSLPQITNTFWENETFTISDNKRKAIQNRIAEGKQKAEERAKEEKKYDDQTADWCSQKINNASINGSSPYFEKKKIHPQGVFYEIRHNYHEGGFEEETIVLIPLRNINEQIRAIQEIYPSKRKFKTEDSKERDKNTIGKYSGCFFTFGELEDGKPICLAEGYATAASIFESINISTVMVVSRVNILHVAKEITKKYPNSKIIICGDDDKGTDNNPGRTDATNASLEIDCKVVFPEFPEGKSLDTNGNSYTDFNDLMIVSGKDEVKKQIESATSKDQTIPDQAESEEYEDEIGDNNVELKKATANARRRALINKATYDDIVKDIRNQHSTLSEKANEIASKALLWSKKYQLGNVVIVGGIPKKITDMKALDYRFSQLEAPGNPCIIIFRQDSQPISDKDFNKRLSGEVVLAGVDAKGLPKYLDASKFWSGNINKRIYTKIAFTSQPVTEDTYNLFTGFGIKPKKGKCERILNHIEEVICASDAKKTTALINLLAWDLQNIGRPSRVITVLKSKEQQIGKGTLLQDILKEIYGNAGLQTCELDQILGRFNDSLRGKSFIYLDEALFAGNRKAADAIKSLSTATNTGIETKNVPIIQLPIGINFFLTTNHDDAAYIEETDARYWILEVSPHRQNDFDYFNELYSEINNGGREAFMDYLLNLDVSGFLPARDVPKDNAAKDAMIRSSINPFDARKWLEACCNAEMLLGQKTGDLKFPWEPWIKNCEYPNGIFSSAYVEWQKTVKSPVAPQPTPDNKFGEYLTKAGFDLRIDGQRYRKLPDPNECLKKVKEMIEKSGKGDRKSGK